MLKRNYAREINAIIGEWQSETSVELASVFELQAEVERLRKLSAAFIPKIKRIKNKALFILALDVSGSMGSFDVKMAEELDEIITASIRNARYAEIDTRYIAYHTESSEVPKSKIFSGGKSGGTITSTSYEQINRTINAYEYQELDVFVINVSDGDNLTSDNERCLRWLNDILPKVRSFDYVEINQYNRSSTLMSSYRHFENPRFRKFIVRERTEMYAVAKTIITEVSAN
jgi:hypothetical protein